MLGSDVWSYLPANPLAFVNFRVAVSLELVHPSLWNWNVHDRTIRDLDWTENNIIEGWHRPAAKSGWGAGHIFRLIETLT